jgi:Holliday junction resolvase RusA-like endonuclease
MRPTVPAIPDKSSFFVPPTEDSWLPVCLLAFVFVQVAMSLVLFHQSRALIRETIHDNELDILIGRSAAGGEEAVSFIRIIMQGEPQSLQPVRRNTTTGSWYDPLRRMKEEMKRRITAELRELSENMPIFPAGRTLKLDILFVVRANKDIDNMLKPFLDVLEGIVYDNDSVIFEIHAQKNIMTAVAPDSSARVDVTISPT